MNPSKTVAREALREAIQGELDAVERVAAMARDEVSSAETQQEGKYDTRATEASYLARGQAWRVAALRRLRAWFDLPAPPVEEQGVIAVGSLTRLSRNGQATLVLVLPAGGATTELDGEVLRGISPQAPLGAALLGLEAGDVVEVETPGGVQTWGVVAVDA